MPTIRRTIFIAALAFLAVFASACAAAESANPPAAPSLSIEIHSADCQSMIIEAGSQVSWTNKDQVEHIVLVQAADGTALFDAGVLQPGDTASFTFTEQGVYPWYCSADRTFTGTIAVEQ